MNIEIANRLVNLRKSNNLSQQALAEKLGISRQAVSKWERAEASPDTDNLILLSRLYGVSLDQLLQTEEEIPAPEETPPGGAAAEEEKRAPGGEQIQIGPGAIHVREKDGSEVHIGWNGIHVNDSGGETVHIGSGGVYVNGEQEVSLGFFPNGLLLCAVTIVYLLIGSLYDAWHPGWLLFFLIPIFGSLYDAVRKKNAMRFAYPVLATLLFLLWGIFGGDWHPGWIWFITIPVYYCVAEYARRLFWRGRTSGKKTT